MNEAHEYIESVQRERDTLAQKIREFRTMVRDQGYEVRKYNQGWYPTCYSAPLAVTPPSLLRQIKQVAEFAASEVPDYTQDDGYSMCGMEDAAYEARDDAADHAHMLLSAYIIQTREANRL